MTLLNSRGSALQRLKLVYSLLAGKNREEGNGLQEGKEEVWLSSAERLSCAPVAGVYYLERVKTVLGIYQG